MDDQVLITEPAPGAIRIALNVPDRANALSTDLVGALLRAVESAPTQETRVLCVGSTGRAFCGGFDLDEQIDDAAAERRFMAIGTILNHLRTAPYATVACIGGAAYGAGADLATACDFRVATDAARFRFPGARFGMVIGVRRLAEITTPDAALDLILRARVVDATEALELGLVSTIVGDSDIDTFVTELAGDVAGLDQVALATVLRTIRDPAGSPSDAELLAAAAARPGLADRIGRYAQTARDKSRER